MRSREKVLPNKEAFFCAEPKPIALCRGEKKETVRISSDGFEKDGASKWTRTTDPRITNALLYQLSYTGMERV